MVPCCTLCTPSFIWQFVRVGWWWLFTLSGVCVDWQAFTEIAVYNIRVSILVSPQQPQKIKQSLSDSRCAPGSVICYAVCCVMYAVLCLLLVLGPLVWFLSNFCSVISWAAIAGVCYSNSLLQTHNRFSVDVSHRLRAALSETGSGQDSASLTETEREESNIATEVRICKVLKLREEERGWRWMSGRANLHNGEL